MAPPVSVNEKVLYSPNDIYADQNIVIRLLDGSTLEIWGTAFYNGTPLAEIGSLPIATQPEAEAGVDNTKVMTPLRVSQAIDFQVAASAVLSVNGETGAVTLIAAEIPFTPGGSIAATDVQAAILEAKSDSDTSLSAHTGDTTDAHDASAISVSPVGSVAATDVQSAIQELATEKISKNGDEVNGTLEMHNSASHLSFDDPSTQFVEFQGVGSVRGDLGIRIILDGDSTFAIRINGSTILTASSAGLSSTVDLTVPDEAYGSGWDGSLEVPTKNALFDKIETLGGGGGGLTQEQVEDVIGAMFAAGTQTDCTVNYNDTTGALSITVTGVPATSVATGDIVNDAVTYAKIQNVTATDRILGRSTAGAGDIEEITCTSTARSLLDDASTSDMRTTLGLAIGTNVQAFDADLSAVAGLSSNGSIHRTGAGTAATRVLTGTTNRVTVTNGDGVSGNPTFDVGSSVYVAGGTDVALADGGTGASLTDPNADRIMFWDDSAGAVTWLAPGTGLAISGTSFDLDSDLATIAGLTATTDNFIVSVSSAWASRTPAQVKTTLAINNVDNTSDANKPVSTATQTALDLKADKSKTINAQTGTTYTLVLADASKLVTLSNAAAITLTVPTNASVAYPVGTTIDLAQIGAGQVTITPAGGVTVNGTPGLKHRAQYSGVSLVKLATDTWLAVGDLAA